MVILFYIFDVLLLFPLKLGQISLHYVEQPRTPAMFPCSRPLPLGRPEIRRYAN